MSLHFAVFYGSVRSERQGIKYARFLNAQLAARGHQVSFVDPSSTDCRCRTRCTRSTRQAQLPIRCRSWPTSSARPMAS